VAFTSLFSPATPISLIDCIANLLRYNPRYRLTSAQCLDHPYYHLTLPHLRAAAKLPSIPFSQGQPTREVIDEMLSQGANQPAHPPHVSIPSTISQRSLPPSHGYSPARSKPAFGTENGRTLPPPNVSSDSGSGSQIFFPSRHGSSPSPVTDGDARSGTPSSGILHNNVPGAKTGASALVDQLRELDLPTADLASYGHRAAASPGARSIHSKTGAHSWTEAGQPSLGPILPPPQQRSTNYQVAMDRGAYQQALESNHTQQHHQRSALPVHMLTPTALASGSSGDYSPYGRDGQRQSSQEHMEDVVMAERATDHQRPLQHAQPPVESTPPVQSSRASLLLGGKKKKWGLSSVFGKDGDSKSQSQAPAPLQEQYAASTLSLKRTQSGHIAGDRRDFPEPSPTAVPVILDPKKAKKEAERQAKDLERAKRDAAERAQKERARAVMQKRSQLQQERKVAGATTEFEWSSVESPRHAPPGVVPTGKGMFGLGNMSVRSHNDALSRPEVHGQPPDAGSSDGGQSQSSSRQAPSATHSRLSHQSMQALQAQGSPLYDPAKADAYRAKARRRDDDDDHSTSSLSVNRFQSPSSMSVGTIDSE
jgi:meiosis induction protein kinase IME2/SME1